MISSLDSNIHMHIMQYLDVADILAMSRTCKFYRNIIQESLCNNLLHAFSNIDVDMAEIGILGSELDLFSNKYHLFENACDKSRLQALFKKYNINGDVYDRTKIISRVGRKLLGIILYDRYNTLVRSNIHVFTMHYVFCRMMTSINCMLKCKKINTILGKSSSVVPYSIMEVTSYMEYGTFPMERYGIKKIVCDAHETIISAMSDVFNNIPLLIDDMWNDFKLI